MESYKHHKIKDLIVNGTQDRVSTPDYALENIHYRSTENSAQDLEDKAIRVADKVMEEKDPKLALDAAKATMSWLGKGSKASTTIFARNAQVNQLTEDPEKSKHILTSLRSSIALLTQGTKITEETL